MVTDAEMDALIADVVSCTKADEAARVTWQQVQAHADAKRADYETAVARTTAARVALRRAFEPAPAAPVVQARATAPAAEAPVPAPAAKTTAPAPVRVTTPNDIGVLVRKAIADAYPQGVTAQAFEHLPPEQQKQAAACLRNLVTQGWTVSDRGGKGRGTRSTYTALPRLLARYGKHEPSPEVE